MCASFARARVLQCLPPGARLLVDRRDALFVTRAPVSPRALACAGFDAVARGSLTAITPSRALIGPLTAAYAHAGSGDALFAQLLRLSDRSITHEELMLLTRALKRIELGGAQGGQDIEKSLRQAAAVCLRQGEGGGALALVRSIERYAMASTERKESFMKVKWLGHSCFLLTAADGRTLLSDPFDAEVGYPTPGETADVVTCSHKHSDHHAVDVLPTGFTLVDQPGEHHARGLVVNGIASFHDDQSGLKRGGNIIYVTEIDGLRIAHMGDLGHQLSEAQREMLGRIDVMLVPVGGTFTIDGMGAAELVRQVKPRIAIPMHFSAPGIDHDRFDISDERAFVDQFDHEYIDGAQIELTPETLDQFKPVVVLKSA